MNIDTKNMETFIQVAELCSFTKAAKKLGYSQSTVSFQIRQLEEMLNVRLLERINHTVALTEAGRKVLNYAHRLEQLTVDMEKELRPQPSVSGHVRMALADSLACWILREHYENFRAAYPGITLKMATASTEELFRMLNQMKQTWSIRWIIMFTTATISSVRKNGSRPISWQLPAFFPFPL